MKKLRSILALLMVAAMLLSFGAVAFADDEVVEEEPVADVEVAEEPAADGEAEAPEEDFYFDEAEEVTEDLSEVLTDAPIDAPIEAPVEEE